MYWITVSAFAASAYRSESGSSSAARQSPYRLRSGVGQARQGAKLRANVRRREGSPGHVQPQSSRPPQGDRPDEDGNEGQVPVPAPRPDSGAGPA
jgi:hypothetical protein